MDDDDHPLLVELNSLRETAARFQHEAHAAAIKLQRHSFDISRIHEHAAALDQENARLSHEVETLRTSPDVPHHPAVMQIQELSLALRRASDKIVLTEQTLLERTSELTLMRSELSRAKHAADGAYELAAHMRAREEACKARERELEFKARASEEERKMVDLVVQEYADLVRNLEGRKSANPPISNGSASTLVDTLQDGKFSLHKMLTAFSTESESLHTIISELNAKVSTLQMTLDAERKAVSDDRTLLSQTKTELDKLNLEDQTAAKMVARYMKFSQASINALQEQITTLKTRHTSTIATLDFQLSIAESQLASERARTERLQDALDEVCEDLARESYGRRREVALRLSLLSREEGVSEFMRRWVRRARELYARCYDTDQSLVPCITPQEAVQEAFYRVISDAESLLSTLDDDIQFSDGTCTSGSLARITLSRTTVDALRNELQDEMRKRVEAVRKSAFSLPNGHLDATISGIQYIARPKSNVSRGGRAPGRLSLSLNGNAGLGDMASPVESPRPQDADSPSMVGAPEQIIDDPFIVPGPISPSTAEMVGHTTVREVFLSSIQNSVSTSATTLVEEELKAVQLLSPAVSMLELREGLQLSRTGEAPTADEVPIHTLPNGVPISDAQVLSAAIPLASMSIPTLAVPHAAPEIFQPSCTEKSPITDVAPIHVLLHNTPIPDTQVLAVGETIISSALISNTTPATFDTELALSSSTDTPSTLFSELGETKHRYDALQRAFRDCSHALKELKRTLTSPSPSPHIQTKHRRHLETALARIDDYAEDARVELEIRVADEELTVRGFEMVLSVPAALVDADERAEVEASARAFVDGTDEDVARALSKFGKKLEDVQHDVAVVKRALHGLATEDGVNGEDAVDAGTGAGTGWTAWTAGLLGASTALPRSPTPVQTFGAVITSPQLRHAESLKQEDGSEGGPLARLNLRVPMPLTSLSPPHAPWTHLGLGRPTEGVTRPRMLSAMYAVGALRSSSVGLGVGLGRSPSSARTRGITELGMENGPSPPRPSGANNYNTEEAVGEEHDLGGVE